MERDRVSMSQKELARHQLLGLVEAGRITLQEASERMGLSYRQAKRWKKRYLEAGAAGLVHGNRGRPSPRGLSQDLRVRILELSDTVYVKFNDSHFTEKLQEVEGIEVSRETVRRLRRSEGIKPKRKRRPKKHYRRRPRKTQEGLMVLWDGSPHAWLGPERPPCCLMAAVDDATGRLLGGLFIEYEGSHGYFLLLQEIVNRYGLPSSIYQDRHGALCRNDNHWTLEEQLAGRQEPTQVGRALDDLGIQALPALTPQAKGRVERLFGVLQDRLLAEMDLLDIQDIPHANRFLQEVYIEDHNRRFALPPQNTESAWRPVPRNLDLDRILSFRYQATVGHDNAVRLGGLILDIPEGPNQRGYAKARVDVHQLLTGEWRIYYHDRLIAEHPATELQEPIRARKRNKTGVRGAKIDTWAYQHAAS
jgi:transposase